MFLARIDGTVVPAAKHESLEGCRFLVLTDWMGAAQGATVLVSSDGDIARQRYGNTTPARMVVAGIVDALHAPKPLATSQSGSQTGRAA